jgi:hypothetical protein
MRTSATSREELARPRQGQPDLDTVLGGAADPLSLNRYLYAQATRSP